MTDRYTSRLPSGISRRLLTTADYHSMIEAGINDGDVVICRRARSANRGDIVVAQTDEGEATLKYWYPEANRVRLQPANSSMRPIYARNVQVLGVATGVVRKIR